MNATSDSNGSSVPEYSHGPADAVFMTLWVMFGIGFVLFPFCATGRKRKLCFQRIRERRWIQETDEDDWYSQMVRDRQARREPPPAAHQMLRISPSQEDDIRKQYLWRLFENYTLTLSQSDIHESDHPDPITKNETGRDEASSTVPTSENIYDGNDIESPPISFPEEYDHDEALKEMDLAENNLCVYVPMAGKQLGNGDSGTLGNETTRQVPSGCAVCLSQFCANERITWSSNADCSHVFHQDCLLRWFQAVGSKHQAKQLRQCPTMSEEEALDLLFKFPKLCPCCRRPFCIEMDDDEDKIGIREGIESSTDDSSGIAGSVSTVGDLQSETEVVGESNRETS